MPRPQAQIRQNPAYRPSVFLFRAGELPIIVPKHARLSAVAIWILAACGALAAEPVDSFVPAPAPFPIITPNRIAHIVIVGNTITKPFVIRAFCDFDTGMAYDSLALRRAERRLRATRLFLSVNLLSLREIYGYDIYIMVAEYPLYVTFPPVLDINHYFYLHHDLGSWYCPVAGMELTNLGGRMENLGVSAQVGAWQDYTAYWMKPLFPSKYYIGISAGYWLLPDPLFNWNLHEAMGSLTIGRRFLESSKAYCNLSPDYRTVTDSLGEDSVRQHQVYAALGWISDLRSSAFDPSGGVWFQLETRSNYLYHDVNAPPYVQFTSDIKWYVPFLFRDAKFAFHLYALVRTGNATYFDRVLIGGINSVRGYYTDEIGWDMDTTNDACIFSCEYRFPLYKFPPISDLMPENYTKMLGRFSDWAPRIDGALIGDWGRVSENVKSLIGPGGAANQTGSGIGFGLRVTEPTLKLTGCSDFMWSESLAPGVIRYGPQRVWNLYAGINF